MQCYVYLGACRSIRSGFERPFFRLTASGCIDDKTNIVCFAVFARRKNCSLSGRRASFPTKPRSDSSPAVRPEPKRFSTTEGSEEN